MKLTKQLLQRIAPGPLEENLFLDLSSRKIILIERLEECKKLRTLILEDNAINMIDNIECCRELWNLDLSGNKVKNLEGLVRFVALGSLVLTNNNLDWQEIKRLSHLHILSLSLTGNPKLDNDPHYRHHVIDILPHLWMLDGQLITSGERQSVKNFFSLSATTLHPIRHKFSSRPAFIPSNLQNLSITGIFGERTAELMGKFPMKYTQNIDLDKKRIVYLASILESDLKLENDYRKKKGQYSFVVPPLQKLMEQRIIDIEQCNMLLLLLVTSLEFQLPNELMVATLDTAKISHIGDLVCRELFSLPSHVILKIASLLLSGATIDREEHKEGGLYPRLYKGLQFIIFSLHKTISVSRSTVHTLDINIHERQRIYSASSSVNLSSPEHQQYRCLIASEVVHLMCLVPLFFDRLEDNQCVLEMVAVATNNRSVGDIISHLAWKTQDNGGDIWTLYHEIASYLLETTASNVFTKRTSKPVNTKPSHSALRQVSSLIFPVSRILYKLKCYRVNQSPKKTASRSTTPPPRAQSASPAPTHYFKASLQPELGDLVMCTPERFARIVAIPEPHVAVLQLTTDISSPSSTGPLADSYFYVDPRGLTWDTQFGYWARDNLSADLSAERLHPSPSQSLSTLLIEPSPESSLLSLSIRPHSQLSDDLQTIPSVEELSLDGSNMDYSYGGAPIKVNINNRQGNPMQNMSQRPRTPEQIEEAKLYHQHHVLEQYTLNKTMIEKKEKLHKTKPKNEENTPLVSRNDDNNETSNIVVPKPKLSLSNTWDSTKSLSHSLTTYLPSSKHTQNDINKELTDFLPSASQLVKTSSSKSIPLNPPVQVIQAWAPARPGSQPKQTKSSIARTNQRSPFSRTSPSPSQSCSSVVLRPRSVPPSHTPPYHLHYYNNRVKLSSSSSGRKKSSNGVRRLGDVHSLSILGTSVW